MSNLDSQAGSIDVEKNERDIEENENTFNEPTTIESTVIAPAEPPNSRPHQFPEGSLKGWLSVLGGWCVMFITFGYMNAFGYVALSIQSEAHEQL